jgi:membrane-bound lytic murein transglycosylase D
MLRPDNGLTVEIPSLPDPVDTSAYRPDELYYQSIYTVAEGDNLTELGKIFSCTGYNLKAWNNLTSNDVIRGQELSIWFPKELLRYRPVNRKVSITPAPSKPAENDTPAKTESVLPAETKKLPVSTKKGKEPGVVYHQLQRNESLLDVAQQFPGVTVKNLLEWNGLTKEKPPLPGAMLKIKSNDGETVMAGGK